MQNYLKTILLFLFCLLISTINFAQENESPKDSTNVEEEEKKNGLTLEPGRTLRLKTDEGTWLSLDVSPDGKNIVFDLLGDIYTLPITGGKAKRITKGLAFDSHPKFSPDGKHLLFTSDRNGNENIWIKDLETGDSTQVTKEKTAYIQSAEWTPDGNYLIVAKGRRNLKMFMFHKDGGGGVQLIKEPANIKAVSYTHLTLPTNREV